MPYICDDAAFTRKAGLIQHISTVHVKNKTHKCSICGAAFSEKGNLNKHTTVVHEGKKPYKCATCDAAFTKRGALIKHLFESVHEKKEEEK